jgi:hypothetical protein
MVSWSHPASTKRRNTARYIQSQREGASDNKPVKAHQDELGKCLVKWLILFPDPSRKSRQDPGRAKIAGEGLDI